MVLSHMFIFFFSGKRIIRSHGIIPGGDAVGHDPGMIFFGKVAPRLPLLKKIFHPGGKKERHSLQNVCPLGDDIVHLPGGVHDHGIVRPALPVFPNRDI